MRPGIVVDAFDRPQALSRLLASLSECRVGSGTELVISVDGGGARRDQVLALARGFDWPHGPMNVMERDDLGLVEHVRACGDLVDELGPLVLLEDDLVVGPNAIRYAAAALEFSAGDPRVAGVSLSTPWFDGFRHLPFEPLIDGSAAVFAKVPWFHGMAWTPDQWHGQRLGSEASRATSIPSAFDQLDDEEWFPAAVRGLVETDRWYLLARDAHAVNFGDAGVHFDEPTAVFQRPLSAGVWSQPSFLTLDDPAVVPYDEFMEPDGRRMADRVPELAGLDVVFDLRGVRRREQLGRDWVVTSRPSSHPVRQWGALMHPLEQNLISGVGGDDLTLCRAEHVEFGSRSDRRAESVVVRHGSRGRPPGLRSSLRRTIMERFDARRGWTP